MDNDIQTNDFTETLTPPSNCAHGHGMNLTFPIGASGKFLEWEQAGKLEEFISICEESQHILRRRHEIEQKLQDCNVPAALIKLKRKKKQDFAKELKARVQHLENKKLEADNRLLVNKLFFQKEAPELVRFTEEVEPELSFSTSIRRGTREPSPSVAIRTAIIQKYPDHSHQEICKILDGELSARELPERWMTEFEVESFDQAYKNAKCRPRVHTMISKARRLTRSPKILDN